MIVAKIVADSLPPHEVRLTTFSLVYPRFIHSEVMAHRVFSRNAASSRAIPIKKVMEQLEHDPAMPIYWGKSQKGMQAVEELTGLTKNEAIKEWLAVRDSVLSHAKKLEFLGLHRQISNRILEPFQLMNTIITATDWDNFFNLRADSAAQPEFKALAEVMLQAMNANDPMEVNNDYWHLPYVTEEERINTSVDVLTKYSVARCARVSYKTHGGVVDQKRDIERHDDLLSSGHLSPFEHQATPLPTACGTSGNFRGWKQYRKTLSNPYETACSRLIIKKRSSPMERLWLAVLERDDQLAWMPKDTIVKELQSDGFPESLINKYLNRLSK